MKQLTKDEKREVEEREIFEVDRVTPLQPPTIIAMTDYELDTFFPGALGGRLKALLPDAVILPDSATTTQGWEALLKEVRPEIVISGWCTRLIPEDIESLRYVCHVTGSVRNVVPRELIARGLPVTNWGNIAGAVVAEHALLLVLGLLRAVPNWADAVANDWTQRNRDRLGAKSLFGRRVGIHGFGQVARELLKLLAPFGVDVMVYSRGVPSEQFEEYGVSKAQDLHQLASWGDVFVTCEALTEQNHRSIDRDVLNALPRGGVFVNVGRGAIVDEEALADVAIERGLRVGCDVFQSEPLCDSSRLLKIPTSLYTPHIAGPTPDAYPKCGMLALSNLERFLNGQPLEHLVPLHIFDRST